MTARAIPPLAAAGKPAPPPIDVIIDQAEVDAVTLDQQTAAVLDAADEARDRAGNPHIDPATRAGCRKTYVHLTAAYQTLRASAAAAE